MYFVRNGAYATAAFHLNNSIGGILDNDFLCALAGIVIEPCNVMGGKEQKLICG